MISGHVSDRSVVDGRKDDQEREILLESIEDTDNNIEESAWKVNDNDAESGVVTFMVCPPPSFKGQRQRWRLSMMSVMGIVSVALLTFWNGQEKELISSVGLQARQRPSKHDETQKPLNIHVSTTKVLALEDLSSWSTFPRESQFTKHVLDVLHSHSLATGSIENCGTRIQLSVSQPFQVPSISCLGEETFDCSLMKRVFANKTIPYNVTFGFHYGDATTNEFFMNSQCWANSALGGHFSVPNMEDRRAMAYYGGIDTTTHMQYNPQFDAKAVRWEKRDPIPIWRGTLWKKKGVSLTENPRWIPVNLSFSFPDLLDARFSRVAGDVEIPNNATKEQLHLNAIDPIDDGKYFQEHQVALVIIGIGAAFRTNKHFMTKTAVILQEVELQEWYTKYLRPYVHYIPVREDLRDLKEVLWWVKEHPAQVKEIANKGYGFWKTYLSFNRDEEHFYELAYRLSEFQHWKNLYGEELQVVSRKDLLESGTTIEDGVTETSAFINTTVKSSVEEKTSLRGKMSPTSLQNYNSSQSVERKQPPIVEKKLIVLPKGDFIDGVQRFCEELVKLANGTVEGEEPWLNPTEEWVFQLTDCQNQGESILGNHLSRWYVARIIAGGARVSIEQSCDSPVTHAIPQQALSTDTQPGAEYSWRDTCERCVGKSIESNHDVFKNQEACYYGHGVKRGMTPLEHAVPTIQSDLRSLAEKVKIRQPHLDLDEVTVHIRVGDIARQNHGLYGLVPFRSFADLIPSTAKTIGIVCAPFRQKRSNWGFGDADLNEAVVVSTRDFLQSVFPQATITIRNDESEAFDTVFARMILSNCTICGSSTFCLYPTLASVGEAYIFQSPLYGGEDSWLAAVEERFPSIHYVKEPFILSSQIYDKNVTDIINLLNTTPTDDE